MEIKTEVKSEESLSPSEDLLRLETLDVGSILKFGRKLLGSAGKEYEYTFGGMDPAARLQHQKKTLTARLGLAGEYLEDDLVDEADFTSTAKSEKPVLILSRQNSMINGSSNEPQNGEESGLSKRQLNQLKRKNKQNAKHGANKVRVVDLSSRKPSDSMPTPSVATPYPIKSEIGEEEIEKKPDYFSLDRSSADDDSKIVSEFKGPIVPEKPLIQTEAEEQGKEWPYERMCEFLEVDLFDPNWEIRHGAAMGLREVIRVQGSGAGRLLGKSRKENDLLNKQWLDDLACRLLCVFMLDRFGDYISDNVVAPIR